MGNSNMKLSSFTNSLPLPRKERMPSDDLPHMSKFKPEPNPLDLSWKFNLYNVQEESYVKFSDDVSEPPEQSTKIQPEHSTYISIVSPEISTTDLNQVEVCDTVVNSVVEKFIKRSNLGKQKYGTTLDRTDLSTDEWANHMQEELMDAILYLERLRRELDENSYVRRTGEFRRDVGSATEGRNLVRPSVVLRNVVETSPKK